MSKSKRVLKYTLAINDSWTKIPVVAGTPTKIVLVAEQRGELQLWLEQQDRVPSPPDFDGAALGTGYSLENLRQFRVFGTGQPIPDDLIHVGSAVCTGGSLVWHVYEKPQPQPPQTHPRDITIGEHLAATKAAATEAEQV